MFPQKLIDMLESWESEVASRGKAKKLRRRIEGEPDRVFCSGCIHYVKSGGSTSPTCIHPDNYITTQKWDWEKRWEETERKDSPSWKNRDNDCPDYEEY